MWIVVFFLLRSVSNFGLRKSEASTLPQPHVSSGAGSAPCCTGRQQHAWPTEGSRHTDNRSSLTFCNTDSVRFILFDEGYDEMIWYKHTVGFIVLFICCDLFIVSCENGNNNTKTPEKVFKIKCKRNSQWFVWCILCYHIKMYKYRNICLMIWF